MPYATVDLGTHAFPLSLALTLLGGKVRAALEAIDGAQHGRAAPLGDGIGAAAARFPDEHARPARLMTRTTSGAIADWSDDRLANRPAKTRIQHAVA